MAFSQGLDNFICFFFALSPPFFNLFFSPPILLLLINALQMPVCNFFLAAYLAEMCLWYFALFRLIQKIPQMSVDLFIRSHLVLDVRRLLHCVGVQPRWITQCHVCEILAQRSMRNAS